MGALFGAYLVGASLTEKVRARVRVFVGLARIPALEHAWQVFFTFGLVVIAFIFFRAESLSQAFYILARIFSAPFDLLYLLGHWAEIISIAGIGIGLKGVIVAVCAMEAVQYFQAKLGSPYIFDGASRAIRWGWYYTLLFSVLCFGYFGATTFIYFQF
jgi:hypothetical protein